MVTARVLRLRNLAIAHTRRATRLDTEGRHVAAQKLRELARDAEAKAALLVLEGEES